MQGNRKILIKQPKYYEVVQKKIFFDFFWVKHRLPVLLYYKNFNEEFFLEGYLLIEVKGFS